MIIYGNKATKTGHESLYGTKCSNCGTSNSLEMYTFSRYFHIFWIPIFPYKKEAVTQCNHCKQILNKKDFPSDILSNYEELKPNIKTPIWQFAGLGLIALLTASGIYSTKENDKKDNFFLANPKVGDVYEIKTHEGSFTLNKVAAVKSDSVYILLNQYESNLESGLSKDKINDDASFIKLDSFPIAKGLPVIP